MVELTIDVAGARVEPYAAVPTIVWSMRMHETTGARVHAVSLRTQVRIEPQRRHYDGAERDRLLEMFGEAHQWSESLRPFLWAHMDTALGGFTEELITETPMAVTYDFEVTGSKYLHALGDDGEVPLVFFFSGTVFTKGEQGFAAELVPWNLEARYRLPVSVWRETMDRYFPGAGWLRMQRQTIDRLQRYRTEQALPTWDQAVNALLKAAGEDL
ncbi:MAG: DUF6084 family protein [Acidimicrobiales bacterium]